MILDGEYIKEQAHKPCFWTKEYGFDVVSFTHAMEQNFSNRVGAKINAQKKELARKDAEIAELVAALNADWGSEVMQSNLSAKNKLAALQDTHRSAMEMFENRHAAQRKRIQQLEAREAQLRDALEKMVRNGQKQGWNDSYKADMKQSKEALATTELK